MAAQLVQMVTVVDKSGKAVKSSKHVFSVWKEAKAAYKERKAQIVADRQGSDLRSPRMVEVTTEVDDISRTSSRGHSKPQRRRRHHSHEDRHRSPRSPSTAPTSPTIYMPPRRKSVQSPGYPHPAPAHPGLQRSLTDNHNGGLQLASPPPRPVRSYTSPSAIDMDLAYGEDPDALPVTSRGGQEEEMKGLVSKVKFLLEEADCLQHSATKTIAMLQKNPEAMAAVALTLAEISNIAKTVAPGALASISKSAPAVFSLLASPQFLIAGGVAIGLTVVAFGGYKIIKQIRAKQEDTPDELLEVNTDVSRIETWRRGITAGEDDGASLAGTSVDGEFITPQAAALSRLNLHETSQSIPRSHGSKSGHRSSKNRSSHSSRSTSKVSSDRGERSDRPLRRAETAPSLSTWSNSTAKPREKKEQRKAKKPSPLRLMFQ